MYAKTAKGISVYINPNFVESLTEHDGTIIQMVSGDKFYTGYPLTQVASVLGLPINGDLGYKS